MLSLFTMLLLYCHGAQLTTEVLKNEVEVGGLDGDLRTDRIVYLDYVTVSSSYSPYFILISGKMEARAEKCQTNPREAREL